MQLPLDRLVPTLHAARSSVWYGNLSCGDGGSPEQPDSSRTGLFTSKGAHARLAEHMKR